jgi:hypothetical protein
VRRLALRDDALQPVPLGRGEELGAILEGRDRLQAWEVAADQAHQQLLALDQRQLCQIILRKSFAEMARARIKDGDSTLADMIAMAKRLHRANPKTSKRLSLRKNAAALAKAGHLNVNGREFNPASVKAMIDGPMPAKRGEDRQ